jgi:hypothetical protein
VKNTRRHRSSRGRLQRRVRPTDTELLNWLEAEPADITYNLLADNDAELEWIVQDYQGVEFRKADLRETLIEAWQYNRGKSSSA